MGQPNETRRTELVFRDLHAGHIWTLEMEEGKPLDVRCTLCDGHPDDYSTGTPGIYQPCQGPQNWRLGG